MDNFLVMNVSEPLDEMIEVILKFDLSNLLSLFHHLIEGKVRAQLKHDIDIFTVLKNVVEKDDILMF